MAGCAAAPPGPRGPLLGRGIELGVDWSYAYGPGKGTVQGDQNVPAGYPTSGNGDNLWADLTIIPRRIETRFAPIDYLDVGVQLGWLGGGLDARVGLPATPERTLPLSLAAGFERGEPGLFVDTKPTHWAWVRAEAYPAPAPRERSPPGRRPGRQSRQLLSRARGSPARPRRRLRPRHRPRHPARDAPRDVAGRLLLRGPRRLVPVHGQPLLRAGRGSRRAPDVQRAVAVPAELGHRLRDPRRAALRVLTFSAGTSRRRRPRR